LTIVIGFSFLLASCSSKSVDVQQTSTTIEDKTTISITTMSVGSGKKAIAYYVAEVKLGDPLDIGSIVARGYTSKVAGNAGAVLAINGDFFTYRNNGVIIRDGKVLINKPERDGMSITSSGEMIVYKEKETPIELLNASGVVNSFSFGPVLVDKWQIPEGIDSYYEVDSGRSINGRHPRTGICMVEKNKFIFIVVDGRSPGYSRGMTLGEFAELFASRGCRTAYNLDGGGSSVMYSNGLVVNNPLGKGKERTNGDIIYVTGS
jgi:exopolysaccharide biosynthesis protein